MVGGRDGNALDCKSMASKESGFNSRLDLQEFSSNILCSGKQSITPRW